jgi:surface antigen
VNFNRYRRPAVAPISDGVCQNGREFCPLLLTLAWPADANTATQMKQGPFVRPRRFLAKGASFTPSVRRSRVEAAPPSPTKEMLMSGLWRNLLPAMLFLLVAGPAGAENGGSLSKYPLSYRQGAFYYGSDCGGNSAPEARASRKPVPPGLILQGATEAHIAGYMNCDDRRQAFSVYRDGLEGRLGQSYAWRNSNGGGFGTMTPVRQFMKGAFVCRAFREENLVGMQIDRREGAACREHDGNWHFL